MATLVEWFESKSIGVQLVVVAAVLDPLGLALGYFLGPPVFGIGPIDGAAAGLVVASLPLSALVLRRAANGE